MQLKTNLSVKDFRDRFSHKTSPEWAIGSQVTPDGRFPSGRTDRQGFVLRISKASVNAFTPEARGRIIETDEGCTLDWKVRRRPAGVVALLIAVAIAAVAVYCFGPVSVAALIVTLKGESALWGSALILGGLSLLVTAIGVGSLVMVFYVPRKTKDRPTAHLRRVVGKANILE